MEKLNKEKPIRCDCGKLIAIMRDGKIYVRCRNCKREVLVESRVPEARGH